MTARSALRPVPHVSVARLGFPVAPRRRSAIASTRPKVARAFRLPVGAQYATAASAAFAVALGLPRGAARGGRSKQNLLVPRRAAVSAGTVEGSRVVAVVGRDGVGKSKVCAALLDLGHVGVESERFADKQRLLEPDRGEASRNFSCYNHIYSQRASGPHLHLIDTPGHVDRMPLVDQALHSAHGAVMVCSVKGGVDAACGRILAALEHSGKPCVIFLNGIDKEDGTPGFIAALDALESRLGVQPVVLFAPAHVGGAQTGSTLLNVLDGHLCTSKGCELFPTTGKRNTKEPHTLPVPIGLTKWAGQLREQLVEALAGVDEEMMEVYLEQDGRVPRPMIDKVLIRAVAEGTIIPLVAGSARTGLGIDALQEVIKAFIPGGGGQGLAKAFAIDPARCEDLSADAPCLSWAFGERRTAEGRLLEVRVLGGTLRPGESMELVGVTGHGVEKLTPERVLVHSWKGELKEASAAGPGDIALVPAPESVRALRPALQDDSAEDVSIRRGRCTFALQLESMKPAERTQLMDALEVCLQENDGLRLEDNTETGEHLLSCMGMLHLELLRERLSAEFKIKKLPLERPHVAYHARLNSPCKGDNTPSKKKPGAWANIELVPAAQDGGIRIEDTLAEVDPTRGGKVAPEAVAALPAGIRSALGRAGPGRIPVVDVTARLLDASASSAEEAMACTRSAVEKAMSGANYTIMEPIVQLEVDVPIVCVGRVLADLRERRGEVMDTRASQGENQVVIAEVPLSEILDYTKVLAELSEGEGFFTFRLEGYQDTTSLAQKRIVEELKAKEELIAKA